MGDIVAQGLQLAHGAPFEAFLGAAVVIVGAQLVVGLMRAQEVVEDGQQLVGESGVPRCMRSLGSMVAARAGRTHGPPAAGCQPAAGCAGLVSSVGRIGTSECDSAELTLGA